MAILFLTSNIEPGKDGVGDYTRLLARECVRQNRPCAMISLNDPCVSGPIESVETADGLEIPTLRLPASLPWPERINLAVAFRARTSIDWVSLQFVSYGFNRKGIVGNLALYLEPIVAGRSLHLMFHELWIGVGQSPSLKHRIVGQIQRHSIQKLIRRLKPRSITTTIPFYVSLLESIGVTATELPLFSNIPFSPSPLPRLTNRSQGLFFGSLYPEWKPEPFMRLWIAASAKMGKRPTLISVGRLGAAGETFWKKLQSDYAHDVDFTALGEQPGPQVSALMQVADFGLATSPWHLLGKSGSVAAMLDHGLPVIVTRDEFQPFVISSHDPLLHCCDANLESTLVTGLPRRPARDRVKEVARDFLRYLTEAHPRSTP